MEKVQLAGQSAILLILSSVAVAQYSMTVNLSKENAREGDRVDVTCKILVTSTNIPNKADIAWVKKFDQEEVEIGKNSQINDYFKRNGKYSARLEPNHANREHKYTLTINDLKSTDSGEIGCKLPSNHIEIFKHLIVQAPAKTVRLASKDAENTHAVIYTDNQQVEFSEGEPRNFFCYVSDTYPEPRVRILVGDKDITDKFTKSSKLTRSETKDAGQTKGITALHYNTELVALNLNISYDFGEKDLACIADFPGANLTAAAKSSIKVKITGYRPKFMCGTTPIIARLHQTNVDLKCSIIAEPNITHARVYWKRHTVGNMSVDAGQKDGSYEATLVKKLDDTAQELVLRITHVFPQHFRTYYFEATNSQGVTTHGVELRPNRPIPVYSQASIAVTSITTMILAMLIA